MAPIDPQQLLKALNPLLGPTGAISGPTEAARIASLMRDASKIVSKCIYINILKLETPKETMEKLLSVGGWDTLNDWLQSSKDEENNPLLTEILKVYQALPISVEILKKNNAAKTIKQLCKSENDNVKTLATNIFDEWMKKVKGNNTQNGDMKTKKKKKEGKDEKKSGDKSDSKKDVKAESKNDSDSSSVSSKSSDKQSSSSSKSSRDKDSKHSNHHHHHHSNSSSHSRSETRDSSGKLSSRDKKSDDGKESSSATEEKTEEAPTVRQGSGLKLTIKLGGDKDKPEGDGAKTAETSDASKKRASTVKRPPSKFRSTGLEEVAMPSKIAKSSTPSEANKPVTKRTGSELKPEGPLIKRPRANMPPPLSVPSPTVTSPSVTTTPTNTSPVSPSEIHGKIKLIPARPKPTVIHESSGFMDSITTSSRTYGAFKKKRKLSAGGTPTTTTPTSGSYAHTAGTNNRVPSTPPSPVSPTVAMAKSLPLVPSFYKDTQEDTEVAMETEEEQSRERTPTPTEELDNQGETIEEKTEVKEEENNKDEKERSISPETVGGKESKGLLTTGATKKKKPKKSVRWKNDNNLHEYFFFDLDEDERENVNRPKDFNTAKKQEMISDRRVMETARRLGHDNMMEQIMWYRPKVYAGIKPFEYGKESIERSIQRAREQGVLSALFFNKNMLPDSPKEADLEHLEHTEDKTIPLEDPYLYYEMFRRYLHLLLHERQSDNKVSGGDEFLYNYEEHPEAVLKPPTPTTGPPMDPPMPPQPPLPSGPPGQQPNLTLPPGLNLPPDIMNLLTQLQNTPTNPNDPVMAHVQQIVNSIMCGGNEQSYEQLQQIQQIMNAQMGLPPDGMMQGPPPGMPPMGMPPQGPQMGQRAALLGSAPPGFMPQRPPMGGPPNRFGPPGNWGNQNMGGPPPRGFNMRGPRPARGGRGRSRVLCRHFASGSCRMGSECGFLHPGVNGPMIPNFKKQPVQENPGNS